MQHSWVIDNLEMRKIKIIKSWLIYNGPICFFFRRECLPLSELRNWGRVSITTFSIQVLKTSTTALIRGIFDVSLSKQTNFYVVCHAKAKKGKESENPYCEFRFIVKRVDCGPSDWWLRPLYRVNQVKT